VSPQVDNGLPMSFDICIAVKRTKKDLKNQLNKILAYRRADIEKILAEYHVPQLPITQSAQAN